MHWKASSHQVASYAAQSPHSRRHPVHHHLHSTATKKSSFPSCLAFPVPARVRTFPRMVHPAYSPACYACHHASFVAPLSRSRCPRLQHRASEPAYRHCSSSSECTAPSWSVQVGPYLVPRSLPAPCDRGSNSWLLPRFHRRLLRLRQGRFYALRLGDMGGRSW